MLSTIKWALHTFQKKVNSLSDNYLTSLVIGIKGEVQLFLMVVNFLPLIETFDRTEQMSVSILPFL